MAYNTCVEPQPAYHSRRVHVTARAGVGPIYHRLSLHPQTDLWPSNCMQSGLPFNGFHPRNPFNCMDYYTFIDPGVMEGWAGLVGCSSAAWLSRCHNCVHNLVVRLRGRPDDVNASDYTRKMLVDWYLIALPHLAAHSVAALREPQRPGRLQLSVWLGDSC